MIKEKSKKVFLPAVLIVCMVLTLICGQGGTRTTVKVQTDPRVELMSLIFRLAENPEYSQGRIKSYNQDVNEYFAAFKEHDVVELAAKLRETRGISYDAVMSMAVHVTDAFSLKERIPFDPQPETLESRWTPALAREFLRAARGFVEASKFREFIGAHTALYDLAATRMQSIMEEHRVVDWFDEFFGNRPGAKFEVILGMLNGPANYGARIKLSDKDETLYCVLGVWGTDKQGNPQFGRRVLSTVVHEFCHSYCNPLTDKHASELEAPANEIYKRVEPAMKRIAYSNWKIMMRESLVRASVIRYLLAKFGKKEAQKGIQSDKKLGFFWIGRLSNLLGEYEQNRITYPSLEDFFPKITEFFNSYADRIDEDVKASEKERRDRLEKLKEKSPKIVSIVPINGSQDVDPSLKAIVITFDRPMKGNQWSVMRLSDKFPASDGDVFYDKTRTVFTFPVKLKANTEYELGLNAEGFYGFASEHGDPLYPVVIRFKTKEKKAKNSSGCLLP